MLGRGKKIAATTAFERASVSGAVDVDREQQRDICE
jgi:hypothetical protein